MRPMLTKEKCKTILESTGNKYSDREVELLYDLLTKIIELQLTNQTITQLSNGQCSINVESIK